MTTDDVLCSGVQLNELLDINRGDTFISFGNTVLDDIPEVDINGFKMHAHIILPVGIFSSIEHGQAAETLIIPAVNIAKTPGASTESHRTREYLPLIPIDSASYRLEGG